MKMDKSYCRRIAGVRNLLEGMTVYGDKLEKWGIPQELIILMATLYNQVNVYQQKKNILKRSARQITAAQKQLLEELESYCAKIKELVCPELPKETWPEFGYGKGRIGPERQLMPGDKGFYSF